MNKFIVERSLRELRANVKKKIQDIIEELRKRDRTDLERELLNDKLERMQNEFEMIKKEHDKFKKKVSKLING